MEHNDFMEKYFTDIVELKIGSDVDATVIVVEENYLILDLHSNVEGKIYLDEYTNDKSKKFTDFIKVGDTVRARINKIIDGDNNIAYLSRKHILEEEDFEDLVAAFENKENINAVLFKTVHKGAILKYKDIELFMHESQFGDTPIDDLKGKTIEVEIQSLDKDTKKVRVSRSQVLYKAKRAVDQEKYEKDKLARNEFVSTLKVNDVHKVKVIDIKDKFAIVEIGPSRAILPISQMDHKRFEKVSELLKVGDVFEAVVTENEEVEGRRKIAVSRKALMEKDYDKYMAKNDVGSIVEATVEKKMTFGVVCNLAPDVTGLLHFSEFSYNPYDRDYSSLTHGAKIKVKILAYDEKARKISLSLRQTESNPWEGLSIKIGDVVKATVKEIPEGRSVVLTVEGVTAIMPIPEISSKRINKVEDFVKVGDTVDCKVIDCNLDKWYIRLSMKALEENNREEFVDNSGDSLKEVL